MLQLTRHFVVNWRSRVGGEPDPGQINEIIRQSVRVSRGRIAWGPFNRMNKSLTIYVHFYLCLAITVDHFRGKVVSVLSARNMPTNAWTWQRIKMESVNKYKEEA